MVKKNYSEWSKQELVEEIKKLEKRKKYGIVWEDKLEQVAELCKEKLPVLTEDKTKEIETDKGKPVNILIEGDNYHALSVLNYTHKGQIDVIYIDPPYNTGNEGFVYNDKIIDAEDSFRHSKWLSFMNKRLKLAKGLLSEKGIFFVSIDDNEYSQLKLLCDEILGENNFIGPFIWKSKIGGGNDNKHLANEHEYILIYAKNIQKLPPLFEKQSEEYKSKFKLKDRHFQERGGYYLDSLYKSGIDSNRPNLRYSIKSPDGTEIWPPTIWRLSKTEFEKRLKNDEIIFRKDKTNSWKIMSKTYFIISGEERGKRPRSVLPLFGGTRAGNDEIKEIFGELIFKYPKNTELMKYLTYISPKGKDSIVLDFFAGTGTTGQAILELNKEDDGKRKFILCTNNENEICTHVCYPRLNKVIKEYKLDGNLKYFRTGFVDANPTDRNKKRLVDKSTEMLCLKEDCFDEVMKGNDFKIFSNSKGKNLGIVYEDDGIEVFKKEEKKSKRKFIVYVFSLDESAREEEFEDIKNLVELKPIPSVILNVYKRIFK